MSRLAPLDKALVLVLVPIWVVCFALGIGVQLRGGPVPFTGIGFTLEGPAGYPKLTGEYASVFLPFDSLEAAGLHAGDRLVRVGETDLRGVTGVVGLAGLILDEAGESLRVPVVFERDGVRLETFLPLAPASVVLSNLAVALAFLASALFLLLRGQPTPALRAYFCLSISYIACTWFPSSGRALFVWYGLLVSGTCITLPMAIRFAFLFPDDRAPQSRWHRVWPWFFGANGVFAGMMFFTGRMETAALGFMATSAVGNVALLAVVAQKYRGVDALARRQMKWVVFGAYCTVLPVVLASTADAINPGLGRLFPVSFGALALFPVFLVVSVVRFNLFDVDRLLSAAASYNLLLAIAGAGALVVVPRIGDAASDLAGIDPTTGSIGLSLALAALVIPAHRRLRPQIDRIFFKERFALDRGIAELLPTLSECSDARKLTERAGAGLQRLVRPEACVVYAGVEDSYAPVFVEGRAVPPTFAASSPLIASLQQRRAPLSLGDAGRRPDEATLGPFDRAALETLQAEVVVPVQQGDVLVAFLCLGPKRSGDVYTSTDLSLMSAVAETVSLQLQRFDQEEVTREAQAMQAALRQYVPGAIAEQLATGSELSSGEREVSVLFVDIRGYVGFSESRGAEEIFSTVNRYTETVSQIVQSHAGSVVEFNGDGMMAVFGAPRELPHKERAAVLAGREIVEAVGSLPVEDAPGRQTKLSVGVGIATGDAFVGNIQAVDRMIWSAIGNTTNLAARLQSLTRELDAALVIDRTTWERAHPVAADFEKQPDVAIRGRREVRDLYALPMRSDL